MKLHHGTGNRNAEKIIKDKKFNIEIVDLNRFAYSRQSKVKKPGSLGYGAYTFDNDARMAYEFSKKDNVEPVVIQIETGNVDDDEILDLTNRDEQEDFIKFANIGNRKEIAKLIQKKLHGYDKNQDVYAGIMTELFIEFASTKHKKYRMVKKSTETYTNGFDQRLGFFNGIEVTIRDNSCIVSLVKMT